ncbi:TLE family member 2, transcriptional corepressor c [Garra rufa]|uniref:TLE family member 2, transcriptional corepressor c n=1 Tax=Garra rufa TaxID=137080 RepID=UPI003CCE8072
MTSRTMYPHGRPQAPLVSGHAGMKFTVLETLDHIKEEFQLFQAQYHSLKLECEKLASEKTEMHRHYIMYYEMSYGLNIEMQKQAEIVKRLSAICTQIIPLLSQEHQHQVAQAVERSKHVSMAELNAIIGVSLLSFMSLLLTNLSQFALSLHSGSGSPVGHRSAGLRLGLPPPPSSSSSSSHADMDNKRGGADQTSTGRTRRESGGKNEDALRRDGTKEKSASPAGVSPRSTEGNGLNSSPVLRKNPSREGSSSPRSQPRSPGLCKSPTQEKVRSPSPSASHESLSPGSPAPPRPLSSSTRGPSPPLKH